MKKLLLSFLLLLPAVTFAQKDSLPANSKSYFALFLRTGIQHMDFSNLHQYGYLLNQPPNTSIQMQAGVLVGMREKFMFSAYMGYSGFLLGITLNRQKVGSYNDYTVRANGSYATWGSSFFYKILRNKQSKFFHAIYPNAGIQFVNSYISSKAEGRGTLNADTTFYLESSHATSMLVDLGVMIELPKLFKKKFMAVHEVVPATLSAGYTLQIQDPKWKYTNAPVVTGGSRTINQGGFYVLIGYNFWFYKGMMKAGK
jgi:hypothetical protein